MIGCLKINGPDEHRNEHSASNQLWDPGRGNRLYKEESAKVHKVCQAILDQFSPSPVTLCHTSRNPPKVRHISRTSRFFVVHAYIGLHMSLQGVCLRSRRCLLVVFCLGIFVWKVLSEVVFVLL